MSGGAWMGNVSRLPEAWETVILAELGNAQIFRRPMPDSKTRTQAKTAGRSAAHTPFTKYFPRGR